MNDFAFLLFGPVGILILTVIITLYVAVRRPAGWNSFLKMWGGEGQDDPLYPFSRWTAHPSSVPWKNKRLQFGAMMLAFFGSGLAYFVMVPSPKPWAIIGVFWVFAAYFLWLVVRITRFGNRR